MGSIPEPRFLQNDTAWYITDTHWEKHRCTLEYRLISWYSTGHRKLRRDPKCLSTETLGDCSRILQPTNWTQKKQSTRYGLHSRNNKKHSILSNVVSVVHKHWTYHVMCLYQSHYAYTIQLTCYSVQCAYREICPKFWSKMPIVWNIFTNLYLQQVQRLKKERKNKDTKKRTHMGLTETSTVGKKAGNS